MLSAIDWKPMRRGWYAQRDGRHLVVAITDAGQWTWSVSYEGEPGQKEGFADSAKAAKAAASRL